MNIKKLKYEILVILLFILIRIPALGHDTFNTDVWKWKARIYDFGTGVFTLDFQKTIQKYHPGVTLMWLGSAAVKVYNAYYDVVYKSSPQDNSLNFVFELHFVQKLFVVSAIAITLGFIFYVLKKLFGKKYAVLFMILLSLEPFYLALSRELHLEGLMSTFMLASFLWIVYWFEDQNKRKRLIISAIFTSLAILTKTSSLFMLPFIGVLLFWENYSKNRKLNESVFSSITKYGIWLIFVIIGFFIGWPAMWAAPVEAISALYRGIFEIGVEGGHEQIFFGRFMSDPGLIFYPVVFAFKSSIYLIPGLLGTIYVFKKLDKKSRKFVFYSLAFALLYFLQVSIPSKKLDRYLIPSIITLVLISTYFYVWLINRAGKYLYLFFGLIFIPGILILVQIHPDYFSYYNPLFGGLRTGILILEPKWLIGAKEISQTVYQIKEQQNLDGFFDDENFESLLHEESLSTKMTVGFQEKYYTQIWPFIRETGAWPVIADLTGHAVKTKYFIYPIWDDTGLKENRFVIKKIGTIKIRGVDSYNIYKREEPNLHL